MRVFRLINVFMKKNLALVIISLFLGVFTILSNVGLLATSSVLISWAALKPDVLDLMVLIVGVRFFGIFRGVFRYFERIISHDTTLRILSDIRTYFYKVFNENYCENNRTYKTGEIYTKLVNDVDILKEFFLRGIYPLIISVVTGIVVTIFLGYFNLALACIFIILFSLCGFLIPYILLKLNIKIIDEENEYKKAVNNMLLDCFNGILEISLYNKSQEYMEEFNKFSEKLVRLQKRKNLINSIGENINSFVVVILMAFVLILSESIVNSGELNGIYYAMLPLSIMAAFEALVQSNNAFYKIYESIKAGDNINSIIDISTEISNTLLSHIEKSDLIVKDISVEEEGIKILENISFELPFGKKLAIVGSTGSGKSTILRTLLGFNKISTGYIEVGGNKYTDIDKDGIRELYTYVDQMPYIFNATVEENLKIADINITYNEMQEIIQKVNLKELIEQLPNKEETLIWQYGASLSGGEKERLAVARSLIKGGNIALLDEPTASMDLELEKKLIRVVKEEYKDKSLILVTHRLIDMEYMDEILVLDKGKIVQRGKHEELVKREGIYKEMYKTSLVVHNIINDKFIKKSGF